jgi:hypothetical protein
MSVTQREDWPGHPVDLGEGFRLHKDRYGRQLEAICWLRTHPLGWELVLNVNGNLQCQTYTGPGGAPGQS